MSDLIPVAALLLATVLFLAYSAVRSVRNRRLTRFKKEARDLLMCLRRAAISPFPERRLRVPHLAGQLCFMLERRGLGWRDIGTSQSAIDSWIRRAKDGPDQDGSAGQRLIGCLQGPRQSASRLAANQAAVPAYAASAAVSSATTASEPPAPNEIRPVEPDDIIIEIDGGSDGLDDLIVTDEAELKALIAEMPDLPTDEAGDSVDSDGAAPADGSDCRSGLLRIDQAISETLAAGPLQHPTGESVFVMAEGGGSLPLDIDYGWQARHRRQ